MVKTQKLALQYLEDRIAPATFGIPWEDPIHLSISFAPDGTSIAGHQSELFADLDPNFPSSADWQREILKAFQTWAVHANISVGLRDDSGDPFGVAGKMQGDPRFGDIRVGAHHMAPDVLAIAVPPDPFFSGTLAGDVFLNSNAVFTSKNLLPVMLHEAGHVFGLDDNDDPNSVMYSHLNYRTELAPEDVQAIRDLYGARSLDHNEPNNSFATATPIRYSGIVPVYLGATPLVAYSDIGTPRDVDYFWVRPLTLYNGPVTFRLQTAGISFLAPRLSIYDQSYHLLGQAESMNVFGDIVSVRLPHINPLASRYYVKVDSAANDVFGVGRYALTVAFDDRLLVDPGSFPPILRGPYDTLTNENDIARLFSDPTNVFFNDDLHNNRTFLTAEVLQSTPGYMPGTHYDKIASITDDQDIHYYRLRASRFRPGEDHVLTVTLLMMDVNGVLPVVSVYDANTNPVPVDGLLNGNGTYTIQAANVEPEASYYLKVGPARPGDAGNYALVVHFGGITANLETFASGRLDNRHWQQGYTLYVARSQLFQFVLSAGRQGDPPDGRVRMEITNQSGDVVFALAVDDGQTASGSSVFLTPGEYRARFTLEVSAGPPPSPTSFQLRGLGISDPVGPVLDDPTFNPMYVCPNDPSLYCYPGGTQSNNSYLWVPDDGDGDDVSYDLAIRPRSSRHRHRLL
jgi:hypothetical protein